MEKITSFTIDHLKLQPGVYVSRKDKVGAETVTTFDLRLTSPNEEPVMNTAEVHTIEHLAATYLRNDPQWKDKVLYFGPDKVTFLSFPSAKCNKVLLISSGISYSDINISFENAATNFSSFSKSP